MTRMTVSDYARHRKARGLTGGGRSAVEKALNTGRISKTSDGMIDVKQADADWERNTDPRKRGGRGGVPMSTEKIESIQALGQARAAHEAVKAQAASLKLKQAQGKLVEVAALESVWFAAGRRVRDALLMLPDSLSPEIVGIIRRAGNDAVAITQVRELIDTKLRQVLLALATQPEIEAADE